MLNLLRIWPWLYDFVHVVYTFWKKYSLELGEGGGGGYSRMSGIIIVAGSRGGLWAWLEKLKVYVEMWGFTTWQV